MAGEELHSVYGLRVASRLRFRAPLPGASPPADFELRRVERLPDGERLENAEPLYRSPVRRPDGRPRFELRRLGERELMRFVGRYDFLVEPGLVAARALGRPGDGELETLFLSSVAAYLLERRGLLALHASAVTLGGRAVALLADSGAGKSSLAAALLVAGAELLTDDILAVEIAAGARVRPGYPLLKVGAEAGKLLWGAAFDEWPLLDHERRRHALLVGEGGVGAFRSRPAPLAAIYLPCPDPGLEQPRIEPVAPREAVIEAVRHTFIPNLVAGVGLDRDRFGALSKLAQRVPFRRLRVPWRLERLPAVAAAVAADLARLP